MNSNWIKEIMAGPKKKLRYSEETHIHTKLAGLEKSFFNGVCTLIMFASKGMYLELTSYTM